MMRKDDFQVVNENQNSTNNHDNNNNSNSNNEYEDDHANDPQTTILNVKIPVDEIFSISGKRKRVNTACLFCKRSHLSCDNKRPCSRCIKRGIPEKCRDPESKVKKSNNNSGCGDVTGSGAGNIIKSIISEENHLSPAVTFPISNASNASLFPFADTNPKFPLAKSPLEIGDSQTLTTYFHEFSDLTDFLDLMAKQNTNTTNTNTNTTTNTNSSFNENSKDVLVLEDEKSSREEVKFVQQTNSLELPKLNITEGSSTTTTTSTTANTTTTSHPSNFDFSHESSIGSSRVISDATTNIAVSNSSNSATFVPPTESQFVLPLEPLSTAERYFLTASCSNTTSDEILDEIIRTKYEAGYIKPYNYVYGYTKLNSYIRNFSPENQSTIYRIWDSLRLLFRDGMYNATEMDLLFIEESFERLLLDYDRVFACIGTPSCLYRRDGAIFKANREFAALVNMPVESFIDGNYGIYELMTEESVINYWDKFGTVYHDPQQKAVLTSCSLFKNLQDNNSDFIKCCFSFTLRRDKFNIPFCIVAHFIPIDISP